MYTFNTDKIAPLYIGKSEKLGKTSNPSTNIKSMGNQHPSKYFFARWCDNYQYHIEDLSAVAIEGDKERTQWTERSDLWFKTVNP